MDLSAEFHGFFTGAVSDEFQGRKNQTISLSQVPDHVKNFRFFSLDNTDAPCHTPKPFLR
jgi:hypothetical protein